MKKGLVIIAATAAVVAVYFLLFYNKSDKPADEPKQQPLAQSKNSEEFNTPFNQMLNSYFDIKNALVEWDTAKASAAANTFAALAEKIPYSALKADTTIVETAKSFSNNVISG